MKENYYKPLCDIKEIAVQDIITCSGIENNNGEDF